MVLKFKRERLNVAVQHLHLKRCFPESEITLKRGMLIWIGELTPSYLSATYKVRVIYKLGSRPKVHVLEPALVPPEGKRLQHVFHGGELCLYYPRYREWQERMLLADTIIPWTAEWLLHYEIWLATGEWCGEGIHPEAKEPVGR